MDGSGYCQIQSCDGHYKAYFYGVLALAKLGAQIPPVFYWQS